MTYRSDLVRKIEDPAFVERVVALSKPMVEGPASFSLDWLRKKLWAAVPVPDSMNDMDAEWIADMSKSVGESVCYAVSTEPGWGPECYEVMMTQEGILAFDLNLSLRSFLLFPLSRSFGVLNEGNYYFVIAGPKGLVRQSSEK